MMAYYAKWVWSSTQITQINEHREIREIREIDHKKIREIRKALDRDEPRGRRPRA